jgi:hypothetical protein
MAVKRINRSNRFQRCFWVQSHGDVLKSIALRALHGVRASIGSADPTRSTVVFELRLLPAVEGRSHSIAFSWSCREGAPLPSLLGSITATHFGSVVNVFISAEYAYGADLSSLLAHEAIGKECGMTSLACLVRVLRAALLAPAADPRS